MENDKNSLNCIKLGLLGDSMVGTSCICNAFINIEFDPYILATIGYDKQETKFILENGKEIKLIIFDTAGQERFRVAAFKALKAVQGIILVFDFTCRLTFENLERWLEGIKDNFKDDIPIVLFGNKIDIYKERWQVISEEAKEYAKKKNLVLFEISAKTKQGIKEGLAYITNKAYLIVEKRRGRENDIIKKFIEKIENKNKNKNIKQLLKYINF